MNQSQKFEMNRQDWIRWGKNALIFLTPAILLFLTEIQAGKTPREAILTLQLWVLNTAIDLLRKFIAGK